MNWPGANDPFYLANPTENTDRRFYYNVGYVPYVRIDGLIEGGSGGPWEQMMLDRAAVDAPLTIALTGIMTTQTAGEMTAEITNTSGSTVAGNLHFVLIENDCLYNGTYYQTVMRDFYPAGTSGEQISLPAGERLIRTEPFTLNAGWVRENLVGLVFVQNDATKEIYQAGRIFFELDEPELIVSGTIVDDSVGGNGNGRLDPGETASISYTLANVNPVLAIGVTGTLGAADPYVTIADATGNWPDIAPMDSETNTADPFVVTAATNTPWGYEAPVTLLIQSGAYSKTVQVTIPVGSPENPCGPDGYGYFAYENSDDYDASPVYSWVEIDPNLGGPGTLVSLSDDATTRFALPFTFRYYGTDFTRVSICSNGWIAMGDTYESSPANGPIPGTAGPPNMIAGFWMDLNPAAPGSGKIYQYTDTANHRYIVEFSGVEHYDDAGVGPPETFQFIVHDPVYYPTETGDGEVVVQYALVSDASGCVAGIENATETIGIQYWASGHLNAAAHGLAAGLAIKYTTQPPGSDSAGDLPQLAAIMLTARPNPVCDATRIAYEVPVEGNVTLRVYNLEGGLVRTLLNGHVQAGPGMIDWDGRSDRGRLVPAGVYFFHLSGPGFETSRKITVQ